MISFWASFAASAIFICASNLFLRESGLLFAEKRDHRQDFLLRYDSLNGLFQTYFIMFAASAATAYAQYFHDEQRNLHTVESGMVIGVLVMISIVHFF